MRRKTLTLPAVLAAILVSAAGAQAARTAPHRFFVAPDAPVLPLFDDGTPALAAGGFSDGTDGFSDGTDGFSDGTDGFSDGTDGSSLGTASGFSDGMD